MHTLQEGVRNITAAYSTLKNKPQRIEFFFRILGINLTK